MNTERGDVVLVDFPFSSGTGSKRRPALVVQGEENNARLTNTIIAMITRTTRRVGEPSQVLIDITSESGRESGLEFMSAITCENLFTINQQLIHAKIGRLPANVMQHVDQCLKVSLVL